MSVQEAGLHVIQYNTWHLHRYQRGSPASSRTPLLTGISTPQSSQPCQTARCTSHAASSWEGPRPPTRRCTTEALRQTTTAGASLAGPPMTCSPGLSTWRTTPHSATPSTTAQVCSAARITVAPRDQTLQVAPLQHVASACADAVPVML